MVIGLVGRSFQLCLWHPLPEGWGTDTAGLGMGVVTYTYYTKGGETLASRGAALGQTEMLGRPDLACEPYFAHS